MEPSTGYRPANGHAAMRSACMNSSKLWEAVLFFGARRRAAADNLTRRHDVPAAPPPTAPHPPRCQQMEPNAFSTQ